MARKYIRITTQPELHKGKRGWSFRYRIPAHHGEPERKGQWQKAQGRKKGEVLAEAEVYRQALEEEINDWRGRGDITLGAWAQEWHDAREDDITPLSWRREGQIVEMIKKSDLGKIPLEEIEPEDIEKQKKANAKKRWSKDKQKRYLDKVKQITREASAARRIKYDPGATIKQIKTEKKERRAVPLLVIGEMLKVLDETPKSGKTAALRIAIGTGFRRGEVLGLQWGDIDLLHKTINLQRQENAEGELTPPKYNSKRKITIDGDLAKWLKEWKSKQTTQLMKQKKMTGDKVPVCSNEAGGYLIPSNFDRWRRAFFVSHGWGTFESVKKTKDKSGDTRYHRTGFSGYKLHEIRHAMATELMGSGADLRSAQAIMGHKRITTTEGYIHEVPDNVRKAMGGIERVHEQARAAVAYDEATRGGGEAQLKDMPDDMEDD